MKKKVFAAAVLSLTLSMAVAVLPAGAKSSSNRGQGEEHSQKNSSSKKATSDAAASTEQTADETNGEQNGSGTDVVDGTEGTEGTDGTDGTTGEQTDTDAGQESGTPDKESRKKGLERALERVKGTPAEQVISRLLEQKYGAEEIAKSLESLADETAEPNSTVTQSTYGEQPAETTVMSKAELKAYADELRKQIKEKKTEFKLTYKTLSALSDIYAKTGDTDEAIEAQKEAILADAGQLEGYKKLAKLYEKAGEKGIRIYVNGEETPSDAAPFTVKGRAVVPLRAITAALKAEIALDAESNTVTVKKEGVEIKLTIGSSIAYVNGKEVTLDVPATVKNGRTFVPFRFISAALKAALTWEPESQSIIINEDAGQPEQPQSGTKTEAGTEAGTGSETGTGTESGTGTGTTDTATVPAPAAETP